MAQPLIRSSAAWALGRYAEYIVADDERTRVVFEPVLGALLDHTKKVGASPSGSHSRRRSTPSRLLCVCVRERVRGCVCVRIRCKSLGATRWG